MSILQTLKHAPETFLDAVSRLIFGIALWLGSVTLSQIAAVVGIFVGLLSGAYTVMQMYVLWRDKIARRTAPE